MGREDIRRQALNVYKMGLLGASEPVDSGSRTLKDATNEAIRDWVTNVENTHYVIGSVVGPTPIPPWSSVPAVIGDEARQQALQRWGRSRLVSPAWWGQQRHRHLHRLPRDEDVDLVGVEAAGRGIETGEHAASLEAGRPGSPWRLQLPPPGRQWTGARDPFDLGGARLPGWVPSMPLSATPSARAT